MANESSGVPQRRFAIRQDRWDTVQFHLALGFLLSPIVIVGAAWISQRVHRPTRIVGWGELVPHIGIIVLFGSASLRLVWRRFSDAYELTPTQLVLSDGLLLHRIPLAEIRGAYPERVRRPLVGYRDVQRIELVEQGGRYRSFDVRPMDAAGFLDELGARCPHLSRRGRTLNPRHPGVRNGLAALRAGSPIA